MKLSDQQHHNLAKGESCLGLFFISMFALIIVVWLCHDTSANLTATIHHEPVNILASLGLI